MKRRSDILDGEPSTKNKGMTAANDATPFSAGAVRGYLHRPARATLGGLVLTHGAGGDCMMPLLVAVAAAFSAAGFSVLRIDLPFRQASKSGAPGPGWAAKDRAGLKEAVSILRELVNGPVYLGGQSYGGRQASLLAAEQPGLANALLLLSYPLHPPGKADQLRTAHFPSLLTPVLFVHGTKDPFGSIDEMRLAIRLIPAPVRLVELDGAGHDLARGRFDVGRRVVTPFLDLAAGHPDL